jgi:hypothetical protein
MIEANSEYIFKYEEVVTALIKHQGLHEGLWCLRAEFGLNAVNVNTEVGSKDIVPAALLALKSLGLQVGTEINALTMDASKVNPKPKGDIKKKAK